MAIDRLGDEDAPIFTLGAKKKDYYSTRELGAEKKDKCSRRGLNPRPSRSSHDRDLWYNHFVVKSAISTKR